MRANTGGTESWYFPLGRWKPGINDGGSQQIRVGLKWLARHCGAAGPGRIVQETGASSRQSTDGKILQNPEMRVADRAAIRAVAEAVQKASVD
jgi:hypothetical protein